MARRNTILICVLTPVMLLAVAGVVLLTAGRQGRTLKHHAPIDATTSSLTVVRSDGELSFSRFTEQGELYEATIDTGIDEPGGLVVSSADPFRALVCGHATGGGLVVVVDELGPALGVTSLRSAPGADFGGVAYSPLLQRVYLFDASTGALSWSPYAPGQTSLSGPTVIADPSVVPALGDQDLRFTGRLTIEDGPEPVLVLASDNWWNDAIPTVRVRDTTTGGHATVESPQPVQTQRR